MDKNNTQDVPKKCFCARCFLPIDEDDKVDVGGQNFHRMCSTCCICRTIPKQLKMFYGHVFCGECFKTHVLSRFRDNSKVHTDSWWMQFAPGAKAQEKAQEKPQEKAMGEEPKPAAEASPAPECNCKRCICARCLQAVDETDKIEIGGQPFHVCCAKCCACHQVPKENIKIYFGQVFCEECFNRLVLHRNKDNPAEFFSSCFEQWKTNPQFAENMKGFMASSASDASNAPVVFMMQGAEQFCRCGGRDGHAADWFQNSEPKKSVASVADSISTWELSFENRTEVSDDPEFHTSARDNNLVAAAEKIAKLTKYLRERNFTNIETSKKWQNDFSLDSEQPLSNWVDLNSKLSKLDCPKCLWQCGAIYVNRDAQQKHCVENFC